MSKQEINESNHNNPRRSTKKSAITLPIFSGIVGGIIGAGSLFGIQQLYPVNTTTTTQTTQSSVATTEIKEQSQLPNSTIASEDATIINAVKKVDQAIVSIMNYQFGRTSSQFDSLFGLSRPSNSLQKAGEGSGVIYKTDDTSAYVVTNNHVIDGADEINVQLKDGTSIPAQIIGTDELTDLAILKMSKEHVKNIATFSNSDTVQTGQTVLAIGSPLGSQLASSVTKGIVSAANRSVDLDTNRDGSKDWIMDTIQTDAAINPGNSGGALVDINGNVVGINSMKIAQTTVEGIGFAIPSNQVVEIIAQLEANGKVTRPLLGVNLLDLSNVPNSEKKSILKLDDDINGGIVLTNVFPNSSAADGGLKAYDVITAINGKSVTNTLTFRKELYGHKIGDKISIEYYRDGQKQQSDIVLKNN